LPLRAPAQNLVLWLLTAVRNDGCTQIKTLRQICRIIGINNKARNQTLRKAIDIVEKWFEQHGGKAKALIINGRVTFQIMNPRKQVRIRPETAAEPVEVSPKKTKPLGEPEQVKVTCEDGPSRLVWQYPDGTIVEDDVAMLEEEEI
jgi:hypothetical protein